MKTRTSIALAAAALLSVAAATSAATMSHSSSGSTMARPAGDTLNLTGAQRKAVWNDLRRGASKQTLPSGFKMTVGAAVPGTFKIEPVPGKVAKSVPSLRPHAFAVVSGKLLIVNPSDKKIAEVIRG